jgi:hypothetical protein
MKLKFDSKEWNWIDSVKGVLNLESPHTNEGFVLDSVNKVVEYLTYYRFVNDYVHIDSIREAVVNCAIELGCVYDDVYELERDIRNYYI